MRSAVCRCFFGAWRSASRIWWMTGRNGPSRGLARGTLGRKGGGSADARIFLRVCQWRSYSRHASRLVISPKTARNHIEHIYVKIGASSRATASLFAMQHGLLPDVDLAQA